MNDKKAIAMLEAKGFTVTEKDIGVGAPMFEIECPRTGRVRQTNHKHTIVSLANSLKCPYAKEARGDCPRKRCKLSPRKGFTQEANAGAVVETFA